jgi:hypothetical protein
MARRPADSSSPKSVPQLASRPSTSEAVKAFRSSSLQDLFWDLLTFDRLMTGPVVHLIYWAGLAILLLGGFATVGGAVGVGLREDSIQGKLVVIPMLVVGLIFLLAGALIWRSVCEFYVAVFRISDDLRALRSQIERGEFTQAPPAPMRREPKVGGEARF